MITVDREKCRKYFNEILSECDPPYNTPVTETELDQIVKMLSEPGSSEVEAITYLLDENREVEINDG